MQEDKMQIEKCYKDEPGAWFSISEEQAVEDLGNWYTEAIMDDITQGHIVASPYALYRKVKDALATDAR